MSPGDYANAIRVLSMDAVEKAGSGHPGAPMGLADVATVLWCRYLRHNPANPSWPNRDRFILSNGHGSMLLYSLLHLSGYDISIDDIKQFRQLHSRTPGHPEHGHTPGVETTTGPLGQGIANAVGIAIAERTLAAQFNRNGHDIINHNTWAFVGDGCLMEGISHECCSLAGTLGLGKLKVIWDDNGISIDGEVKGWFADDTAKRFEAYGWHVVRDVDGHDSEAVDIAIRQALQIVDRPTLICARTVIGKGAPGKQGTMGVHGSPLGGDEVESARRMLKWQHPPFTVPAEIYEYWDGRRRGAEHERQWLLRRAAYRKDFPDLAAELERRLAGRLPEHWEEKMNAFILDQQQELPTIATRQASQRAIAAIAAIAPELIGGSADLGHSNLTLWTDVRPIGDFADGNYIHYGVREFGMSAIANGISLHGGFVPFIGTFLTFLDYARNAVRMAALMKQRVIFVYTHDSIALGEDGPTHQPIEHLESMRCIPGLSVWRPCDAVESAVAWKLAMERHDAPTALCFSRQSLPAFGRNAEQIGGIQRGGYVLRGGSDAVIIATGSEVALAIAAANLLSGDGISARVVSMPSQDIFDAQSVAWRESVLPPSMAVRTAVEAGVTRGWCKYVGGGEAIGMDCFGASAPAADLLSHFGFDAERIAQSVRTQLRKRH